MHGPATAARFLTAGAAVALLLAVPPPAARGQPPAVLAVFADGSETRGVLSDLDTLATAKIGDQPLFAPGKPVRWLRPLAAHDAERDAERATARSVEGPYIEFDNGDLLPGAVQRHEGESLTWAPTGDASRPVPHPVAMPALLVVELPKSNRIDGPQASAAPPENAARVRRERVRRIVWRESAPGRHRPRTLVPLDGAEIAYRSLRWLETGVLVLLDGGRTEKYEFAELATLDLPDRDDPWDAWFDELAAAAAAPDDRFVRVQTDQGLLLTAAVARVRHVADGKLWSNSGFFIIRPSWSLDPVVVPDGHVVAMSSFLPTEVPLGTFRPTTVRQQSTFGGSWGWQAERSVLGGPLCVGGRLGGWGFGVQARTEAVFPLPAGATGFRARVGLDQAVGGGGCARAEVFVNEPAGKPLWQSGLFIGSGPAADTGPIPLAGPGGGQRELVLVADMAHEGRPPAADPYDIRDAVDWIEPTLLLDPATVARRTAARLPEQVPAWRGWTPAGDPATSLRLMAVADPLPTDATACVIATVAAGGPLRLRTEVQPGPQQQNLVVAVSGTGGPEASLELTADGTRWRLPLAPRAAGAAAPAHVLPLDPTRATPLVVEITVPAGTAACWHALAVTGPLAGPAATAAVALVKAAPADATARHVVGVPAGAAP